MSIPMYPSLVTVGNDFLDLAGHKLPGPNGAQNANHANSTSPSSATLSNTAAGYTTLGGRWQFAAPAGASTDFALFAFQVPATHRLIIKGICISAVNTGAAVGATPTILDWALGIGSTAVSLATTDSAPVFGPRRLPLGMQSFLASAAIGAQSPDIYRTFEQGLVGAAGTFVHLILQVPVGASTASQVIRGDAMFDARFDPV
jgi:hypothetical protein